MSAGAGAGRPTGRVEPELPVACGDGEPATTTLKPSTEHPITAGRVSGRVRRLRERMGARDLEVLGSLARLRLLSGDQLRRLHHWEGSAVTQARRTRAQLRRLTDLRLVARLGRRVGGVRAGSSGFVYGLSGLGQAVLAIDGPVDGRRRVWETSPAFEDHVLAVAEIYVRLTEAESASQCELLSFDAEPACWRSFSGFGGAVVTLKPDAYLRLGVGDLERSAFVEVDLGTESGPTIARKCGIYVAYWQSGLEQQRHGVFPSVLWLAPTIRRVEQIATVVQRLPVSSRQLFEVALLDDATVVLTGTARGGRMA